MIHFMPSCLRFQIGIRVVAAKPGSEDLAAPVRILDYRKVHRSASISHGCLIQDEGSATGYYGKGLQHSSPLAQIEMTNLPDIFHPLDGLMPACAGMKHGNWLF